jgi:hypothetical protein
VFTLGAIGLVLLAAWASNSAAKADPPTRDNEGEFRDLIRFIRQDMRLVAYLLFGILVMLGIVADRLR